MNRAVVVRFACSAVLLGTVAVGCKPESRPAALSSVAPRADKQANKLANQANVALAKKLLPQAVKQAEDAVALAPRDAGYRLLLGRAYIASGRFKSAEQAITESLTLYPDNGQALMSLALTQVALGKWDAARVTLALAKGKVGESDRGLAMALAGDKPGGVEALEGAARAEGAGAKARQNLALGYALSGRWAESSAIAGQDLAPDQVRARMTEWAHLSQPKDAWDQVAALLHVTPVEDGGMPVALALAPAEPVAVAAADPAPPADPAPLAEVAQAIVQPVPAPVEAAPVALAAAPPVEAAPPAPAAIAAIALPASEAAEPAAPLLMRTAATTPPPLIAAPRTPARLLLARAAPRPVRQSATGRYVVQLGAFSSAANVESAWRKTVRRVDRLADLAPSHATFASPNAGTVYRLSLAGFESRVAAMGLCRQIRAARGDCFVRPSAGDALAAWGNKAVRLASR